MELLHGTSSAGEVAVEVSLGISESARDWYTETGLRIVQGLFLNVVSGSVVGAVYVVPQNEVGGFAVTGDPTEMPMVEPFPDFPALWRAQEGS